MLSVKIRMRNYLILHEPTSVEELGCWSGVTNEFTEVLGYTNFGNFFLRNPDSKQIAILYTIEPEVVPTNFIDIDELLKAITDDKDIESELIRSSDTAMLIKRLGSLSEEEVFIPEPYPFLGGTGELESYSKGNVWVFADLVGQSQGIGSE
jgi:hypothetical protein